MNKRLRSFLKAGALCGTSEKLPWEGHMAPSVPGTASSLDFLLLSYIEIFIFFFMKILSWNIYFVSYLKTIIGLLLHSFGNYLSYAACSFSTSKKFSFSFFHMLTEGKAQTICCVLLVLK